VLFIVSGSTVGMSDKAFRSPIPLYKAVAPPITEPATVPADDPAVWPAVDPVEDAA